MAEFGSLKPKEWYEKHKDGRINYENRAVSIAKLTLPYLILPQGANPASGWTDAISQAFCGRLVNTLKAKMGMALLPPSTSSFRLEPDKDALEQLVGADPDRKAEVYARLSSVTSQINAEIEAQQMRDTIFDMLGQLIVVGSVIVEKIKLDKRNIHQRGLKLHTLRNFAVDLDSYGEPRGMCILEIKKDLPEGITPPNGKPQDSYNLYTLIERDPVVGDWRLTQAIEDIEVGTEISYSDDNLPFEYVGWTWTDADKYHRPYAEDYFPDMNEYNTLAGLITKGSIVASKVIIFVDEKGNRTRKRDVANSKNGQVVNGNASDVTAFQLQKNFDFQVPMQRLAEIGKNLSSAFLMNESVTRDAERVTAEEIRYMAQELESSSLSGVYSKLSKKVSRRIVEWVMDELNIKFDGISINVITGLDALGRSQETQKLDSFIQRLAQMNMIQWVDESELINRYASYGGIDTTSLIKTPSQVQQERAQAQQAQLEQAGGEAALQEAAKNLAPQKQG